MSVFKPLIAAGLALAVLLTGSSAEGQAVSRVKDIVSVEGVRDNILVGYGLVVGLNGTGDTLLNAPFTEQSLAAMLERLGVNSKGILLRAENVAAVTVTATLPAFARLGTRIDVTISSIGDADDLRGGTLLATPLLGADSNVYAVAQGAVAVAGFAASGDAASVTQGVPTAGRIANGGIVEREIDFELADMTTVKLALHNPDLTTARRISNAINEKLDERIARPLDHGTVQLDRPVGYKMALVDLLTEIEDVQVQPAQRARVVIDEKTGIIVIGNEVRINPVAIAQGNLTITVSETPQVSQPGPLAQAGETAVVPETTVGVEDAGTELYVVPSNNTLKELVDGLNALGVGPRDMITILQAVKAAGAMQAEIQTLG